MAVLAPTGLDTKLTGYGTGGFLEPTRVINEVAVIEPGQVVADFGSGSGYFALALARRVGDTGRVYAVDIMEEPLQVVRNQAQVLGIGNIETIRANLETDKGSTLRGGSVDVVWMANVLFQSPQKEKIIQEASRVLKKAGKLVVIDWIPKLPVGPRGLRVSPQEVRQIAEKLDLEELKSFDAGAYHWGLVFVKH
jgi:ubiquinone/menaquinone biosynthesis C-methylase UbiE